jgi:sigma-B regulation protein RsbU (phosphoserine phosphatase)
MDKGVGAALLGAAAKTQLLRALARPGQAAGPEQVVDAADAALCPRLVELESFVTLAYARFDTDRRVLSFVDCGHTRTLHRDRKGTCRALEGGNLPLGFSATEEWTAFEVALEPGDVFLLYSDGVTEARSPEGELFGVERLQGWLASRTDLRPRALVEALREEIVAFSGLEAPTDDLTCVAVRISEEAPCA